MAAKKDDKNKVNLRSPEIQELMGRIPYGFMRYGIGLILVLLLAVCLACHYIPYGNRRDIAVRILPNVSVSEVTSGVDGTIVRCYMEEGREVFPGDTLLTVQTGGEHIPLVASGKGKVHLCSFCQPHESVSRGQKLMEIREDGGQTSPVVAIADSLPAALADERLSSVEIRWGREKATFRLKKLLESEDGKTCRALWVSEQDIEVAQEQHTAIVWDEEEGTLLEQLIHIDWNR